MDVVVVVFAVVVTVVLGVMIVPVVILGLSGAVFLVVLDL